MKENEDAYKKYRATMVHIINYKEKDENGNERKCTVSIKEAKEHPEKYKIFTCTHPDLKNMQFAYDTELVKKHADTLRELCRILPQKRMGLSYDIWLKELAPSKNPKEAMKEAILGETFFAMAYECRNHEIFWTFF